jgi:hypothetical protein
MHISMRIAIRAKSAVAGPSGLDAARRAGVVICQMQRQAMGLEAKQR